MIIQAMSQTASSSSLALSERFVGVAPLPHLGVIRAQGEDAANFLHNQLTNDVLLLKEHQCRLAAYCNAKGRMQASFVVFKRSAQEILLIGRQDLLAQTVKRLSMFVLRAKVKLTDAWQRHTVNGADVLTLYPALDQMRALWIAPKDVPLPQGPALSAELWQVGEVMSGIAWVEHATFEAFVPQMLNYESVDGVNFKKGCYPGQEVVARSQFRGTLKRRAYIAQCEQALQAGQEVFSHRDASQPCGLVAQAASDGAMHVAVVELQVSAIEGASLHVASTEGAQLQLLELPYPLRDDI